MISRDVLRSEHRDIGAALEQRGVSREVFEEWRDADQRRREGLVALERFKHERNEVGREIGQLKSQGESAEEQIAAMTQLKTSIGESEQVVDQLTARLQEIELTLPNLAQADVPVGADEDSNRIERTIGEPPQFDFEPQAHWDLGPALGILDFEAGARVAGARFTTYRGLGARLERALATFMIDLHREEHGYEEVLPPYLVNHDSMVGSGQFPKFVHDAFGTTEHGYYLIPTAEVPLVNLHRGAILEEEDLPLRYVAWSPCFRAEAGSYGKDVRGLIRQHQFHKVELVQFATAEKSEAAHQELTAHAEEVLERLELPYRVVCLSTGDMGQAASKTYDLEVWLPGQDAYREISSCSNCDSYQARRASIRYRPADGGKLQLAHTLNGSALAVGRTLVAILENYQQADGSVTVPEALRPYLGGLERIERQHGARVL